MTTNSDASQAVPSDQQLDALAAQWSHGPATTLGHDVTGRSIPGWVFSHVRFRNAVRAAIAQDRAARAQAEPVVWIRDQRGEYEGRETLDPLFLLARPDLSQHGATYTPLYASPAAWAVKKRRLREEQIEAGFPRKWLSGYLQFEAGVRFAEGAHGIAQDLAPGAPWRMKEPDTAPTPTASALAAASPESSATPPAG